ncbi:MAG: sortase [Bacilli bacterium]|nr:sortase [Bacilli bacterium]
MLRKVISILLMVSSICILFCDITKSNDFEKNIDNIINTKNIDKKYDGYISIPSLSYKGLIKTGNYKDVLDANLVLMISDKKIIYNEYGNIILAGHNNKYVFSKLYKLKVKDEIIISDFDKEYSYTIQKLDYINIKNKTILDNVYDEKILTLITCTSNNQIRYVVRAKFNHIISHNNL